VNCDVGKRKKITFFVALRKSDASPRAPGSRHGGGKHRHIPIGLEPHMVLAEFRKEISL
jgi:hypothetical protein